jgi:hypothetical protein
VKPEHPGHVRGVGFGVGLGDYFPKEPRNKCKDYDKQKQEWKEQMINLLLKKVSKYEGNNLHVEEEFEAPPPM